MLCAFHNFSLEYSMLLDSQNFSPRSRRGLCLLLDQCENRIKFYRTNVQTQFRSPLLRRHRDHICCNCRFVLVLPQKPIPTLDLFLNKTQNNPPVIPAAERLFFHVAPQHTQSGLRPNARPQPSYSICRSSPSAPCCPAPEEETHRPNINGPVSLP